MLGCLQNRHASEENREGLGWELLTKKCNVYILRGDWASWVGVDLQDVGKK